MKIYATNDNIYPASYSFLECRTGYEDNTDSLSADEMDFADVIDRTIVYQGGLYEYVYFRVLDQVENHGRVLHMADAQSYTSIYLEHNVRAENVTGGQAEFYWWIHDDQGEFGATPKQRILFYSGSEVLFRLYSQDREWYYNTGGTSQTLGSYTTQTWYRHVVNFDCSSHELNWWVQDDDGTGIHEVTGLTLDPSIDQITKIRIDNSPADEAYAISQRFDAFGFTWEGYETGGNLYVDDVDLSNVVSDVEIEHEIQKAPKLRAIYDSQNVNDIYDNLYLMVTGDYVSSGSVTPNSTLFKGSLSKYDDKILKTIEAENFSYELENVNVPTTGYSSTRTDLIIKDLLDGTQFVREGELEQGTSASVDYKGRKTLKQAIDNLTEYENFIWYVNPETKTYYNRGDVNCGVSLTEADDVKVIDAYHPNKNVNKVVVYGDLSSNISGVWIDNYSASKNGLTTFVTLDASLTTTGQCQQLAQELGNRKGLNPQQVELVYKTTGFIQPGELISLVYDVSGFETISGDYTVLYNRFNPLRGISEIICSNGFIVEEKDLTSKKLQEHSQYIYQNRDDITNVSGDFVSHESDTNNPHSVTLEQARESGNNIDSKAFYCSTESEVNSALTSIGSNGGKIIITDMISLSSPITISNDNIIIEGCGWNTGFTSSSNIVYIDIQANKITIKDMNLDGSNYTSRVNMINIGSTYTNINILNNIANGNDEADFLVGYFNYCKIRGNQLYDFAVAIENTDNSYNIITNNVFSSNNIGVYIKYSSSFAIHNVINNNFFVNNTIYGIAMKGQKSNIVGNNFYNNLQAIRCYTEADYNTIAANNLVNGTDGIRMDSGSYRNHVIGNFTSGLSGTDYVDYGTNYEDGNRFV